MPSFFEKLKRGMGIEVPTENRVKEKKVKVEKALKESLKIEEVCPEEKRSPLKQLKKLEIKVKPIEPEMEEELEEKEMVEIKEPSLVKATGGKEKWLELEGQLAVDVYQTESELVIQSAIAGIKPEYLDISMEGDMIEISGERKKPFEEGGDYFSQECYWGHFSRQIILPVEVDPNKIGATLKEGILTIRMPKIQRERKRKIIVKE
jgi:HSP20 family protein